MRRITVFVNRTELMLATIEAAHAAGQLVPDSKVDLLKAGALGGAQQWQLLAPVHEGVEKPAIHEMLRGVLQVLAQEARELLVGHLAGRHRELAMLDLAQATNEAVDLAVLRRIRQRHTGKLTLHDLRV